MPARKSRAPPYLVAAWLGASGAMAQEVHYSPEERLDAIDAALIATAKLSIDMAAFSLTDSIVIDALNDAQHRGVMVRLILDPRVRHDFARLGGLSSHARIRRSDELMHLQAYAIDGQVLRTGSANFTVSGEQRQDSDLVVIRDPSDAEKFEVHFERMWRDAPMVEFTPPIRALPK